MALVLIHETPQWKKLLSYVGPGFLVSVAYLDPGNCLLSLSLHQQTRLVVVFTQLFLTFVLLIGTTINGDAVQTDLQAGANHKYELLWIVLVGLTFALLIQSRSANLGVVTGSPFKPVVPTIFSWCHFGGSRPTSSQRELFTYFLRASK